MNADAGQWKRRFRATLGSAHFAYDEVENMARSAVNSTKREHRNADGRPWEIIFTQM